MEDAVEVLAGPLQVLAALGEQEHVTRTAEALGLQQPTVSRALARVQRAVGVPLLVPQGRGVRLTAAGRALAATAARALAEVERGVRTVREDDAVETGRVALGFLHTLGAAAVPALVRAFREAHPGVRFELHQGAAGALLDQLTRGEVDLVLTSPLPDRPGLRCDALLEQPLVLALPEDHPLAVPGPLGLSAVAGEDFVLFEPGYGLREAAEALFAQAGVVPRVAFEGQDAHTIRGLVAAGLGVAVLPAAQRGTSETFAGVVERPLAGPTSTRTLGLVRRDEPLPRVASAFRDLVVARGSRLL
ncbi:LysR substrate-binding domain-containing protein [Kineococcus aurantiacus]|uniref:DNA-binding transcriptional LysR family regulator n=1 Tax=Kineococcus aurantiacus TaxID=37633 RepID=A0A7Y9DLS7_9ACTN|nr:DNA-binding transcriptional LysR family regulator [Kineococcus aurantiacus]